MSIYKPCDICGRVPTELQPELYRGWGCALGRRVGPKAKFVIGGDVRFSTPGFLEALAEGLSSSGIDVVDLGVLPTPMVYYAKRRLGAAGCAIVTASHAPAELNGLEWMLGDQPPGEQECAWLARQSEALAPGADARPPGQRRSLDVSFDYVAWLQETWIDARSANLRVVLDPMHGCWAGRSRRYLQAIFPRVLFYPIHDEPDGAFSGEAPDCSRFDRLDELSQAVDRERADLGIAFDGDGDRVALVDNEGVVLTPEETTWIFLESFGPALSGESFVYDVEFSDRIPEAAARHGAAPLAERSGHAFVRRRVQEAGAVLGATINGNYFFRALAGGDDGLFAACWIIDYLARTGPSLAGLRRLCPKVYITPELRLPAGPEEQDLAIREVRSAWSDHPQDTTDGVRVHFADGWALVRASAVEPALTFRFEAADEDSLPLLVYRFCQALPGFGEELWDRFEACMGGQCLPD